jgi:hypothetical protein
MRTCLLHNSPIPPRRTLTASIGGIVLATGLTVLPAQADAQGAFSRDLSLDAEELLLENLIGEIRLMPAEGDRYEVRVDIQGKDADSELITIEVDEGRQARVEIVFPVETHQNYVYPGLGRGSRTTIREPDDDRSGSWFTRLIEGLTGQGIHIRGFGKGLEIWADVTVLVPADGQAEVRLGAGKIETSGVHGELALNTRNGPIKVTDHHGRMSINTGSGGVRVERIDGELEVHTGSGGVTVERVHAEQMHLETGSGGIRAGKIQAESARLSTGSGSIVLEMDRMGAGPFSINTGSGGVRFTLPENSSTTIAARTGSGGIHADVEGAEIRQEARNRMELRMGKGESETRINTGSGSVKITAR